MAARFILAVVNHITLVLFLLAGMLSAAAASNCDGTKAPEAGHNVWYCENESETVVVFVHGLHSDNVTAWKSLPQEAGVSSYWPSLVLADNNLKQPSLFLAGFYTEIGAADYGMRDAANELYTALSTPSGPHAPVLAKRNVLFVAHSLGGIIVRDVLVRHWEAFAGKRLGLLLVASPSGGSDYAKMLATTAAVTRQRLVQELSIGSPYLQRLDDDFRLLLTERRIAGLVGIELVENQFVDLGAGASGTVGKLLSQFGLLYAKVAGTRIVEPDSAARYFPRPVVIPKSDHFTISRPTGLNDYAHRELVRLFNSMHAAPAPACEPPPSFRLVLDVKSQASERLPAGISEDLKASLPIMRLWRARPDGTLIPGLTDDARRDAATARHQFAPAAPFPCPGDAFRAKLRPVPITSYQNAAQTGFGDLCFKRSATKKLERSAFLRCNYPGDCRPDTAAPGVAEPCVRTGWRWPQVIATAQAQDRPDRTLHWAAPSLSTLLTLPANQQPGYAEFTVRSGPIASIAGANGVSFAVTVNGVPIYFDGLPPHTEVLPFDSAGGVRLTFGVENLGFTGGEQGYEKLELELRYWKDEHVLKTDRLNRSYVSYRHAPLEKMRGSESGGEYEWLGYYRPAKVENRYEVIVAVAHTTREMLAIKREFDDRRKSYDGKPAIGVIRPPRTDNPVYGLTLGLRLPTEQVVASFTEQQAKAICRWIVTHSSLPQWMRGNSYLYEFPFETITERSDRGRQRAHCRAV